MKRVLLITFALGACVHSNKVLCDDGRICPPGFQCDDDLHRCVSPEQQSACANSIEGGPCEFSGAQGACHAGYCDPLICGDGIVTGAELCDGADFGGATCKDAGFYDAPGLACTPFCTYDVSHCTGFCGDHVTNGDELCDGSSLGGSCMDSGFDAGPISCSSACGASFATCGKIGWDVQSLLGVAASSIHATSRTDIWVVGDHGGIVHSDGLTWKQVPSGVTDTLSRVWAITPSDAWVVGFGPVFDGPGVALHWDGVAWTSVAGIPSANYLDVWAASATDVFVATKDHDVLHWNGATWQTLPAMPGTSTPFLIRGATATDLYVVQADNSLWHWNGATWTAATPGWSVTALDVSASGEVWAVGHDPSFNGEIGHWNGTSWTSWLRGSEQYGSIAAAHSNKDVWIMISSGSALHFDGAAFTTIFTGSSSSGDVVAFGPDEVVFATYPGIAYRYRGHAWGHYSDGSFSAGVAVWSSSPNDIFTLHSNTIRHFNGVSWSASLAIGATLPEAISGTGPTDVWVAANTGALHYTGTTWPVVASSPTGATAIWAPEAGDVWAFAADGPYHGPTAWTHYATGANGNWRSVHGDLPNDIWAVKDDGADGELWRWNGAAWTEQVVPAIGLQAVVAISPTDVFVTANAGHVVHWDGTSWSDTFLPAIYPLRRIAATAHDDIFAASARELFHFDGTQWAPIRLDVDTSLNQIADLFAPAPGRIELEFANLNPPTLRELVRTRPWVCRATETNCHDSVDDDCDGLIDQLDPDCP